MRTPNFYWLAGMLILMVIALLTWAIWKLKEKD